MEFTHSQQIEGDILKLSFEGSIDEDADFPAVDAGKFKTIELDLKGVAAINSVGIREWLDWIKPISERVSMSLTNCPKALVFQFNMVEGFLPQKAVVKSFFVPFFCEEDDQEENVLFEVGKDVSSIGGAIKFNRDLKSIVSSTSQKPMEMDVTESKYFQFLKRP